MSTSNDTPLKRCSKCGNEYPATTEYFHSNRGKKSGLCERCKPCARESKRTDYEKHKDSRLAIERAKYYSDPEYAARKSQASLEWQRNNREAYNSRQREWIAANRERSRQIKKESATRNIKKIRARRSVYKKNNPNRVRQDNHARRDRLLASTEHFTAQDIDTQYRSQKGKCWHCGVKLNDKFHVDHLIPLAKGGTNSPRNIVLACIPCNLSKGAKLPQEWNGRLF